MSLFAMFIFFSEVTLQISCWFFTWVVRFLILEFWEFFVYSGYSLLSHIWFENIFSYSESSFFILIALFFFLKNRIFNFWWRYININNSINVYLLVSSFFFDWSARILSILSSSQKTDFVFIDFYPSFLSSISLIRARTLISFHVLSIPFICFFPACEGGCWGHWFQTKEKWNHTCTQRLLYKCSQKLHF